MKPPNISSQYYDEFTNEFSVGQYYTTNAKYILGNLVGDIPLEGTVIDPFAGRYDLLNFIEDHSGNPSFEAYDICPKHPAITLRDTLLDPPDYRGKWVVTNPPFLNARYSVDKTAYRAYRVNDLYKAAITSVMGCVGGLIILPLSFFCDEWGIQARQEFLSAYSLLNLNVFEEQVFSHTTYTVCSFSFVKGGGAVQNVSVTFFPSGKIQQFELKRKYGYHLCGEFLQQIRSKQGRVQVSRLVQGKPTTGHISNLFLRALDTGSPEGRIRLARRSKPYYGKQSSRAFAQLILDLALSPEQEISVIDRFNSELEEARGRHHSLFLSQFRNSTKFYARKRISSRTAYPWIGRIVDEVVWGRER